ncbi:MAG: hypothetical protein AAGI25_00565 [Bacteroidota bacterium]
MSLKPYKAHEYLRYKYSGFSGEPGYYRICIGSAIESQELMNENNINHLSVTQNDEIVGMLFRNDLKKVEYLSDFVGGKTSHESSFSVVDIKELMTKCLMILREEVD